MDLVHAGTSPLFLLASASRDLCLSLRFSQATRAWKQNVLSACALGRGKATRDVRTKAQGRRGLESDPGETHRPGSFPTEKDTRQGFCLRLCVSVDTHGSQGRSGGLPGMLGSSLDLGLI